MHSYSPAVTNSVQETSRSHCVAFLYRFATIFADIPEAFNIRAEPEGCYVRLSWKIPSANSCPISRYTVHYRECITSPRSNKRWKTTEVNNPNITEYRLPLNCSEKYEVMAIAWNERGSSYADGKSLSVLTENGIGFSIFNTIV